MYSKRVNFGPLRVAELRRLCRDRYPSGKMLDNDLGRALLYVIIRHMVSFCEQNIRPFAEVWAPWASDGQITSFIDAAKAQGREISAEEAGRAISLTSEERRRLGITSMRPADKNEEEFHNWRREWKRAADRRRQRRRREIQKNACLRRECELSERQATLYVFLGRRWRGVARLVRAARRMAVFEALSEGSLRVTVHRVLDELESRGLIESRQGTGVRSFKPREVRRKDLFPVTVKRPLSEFKKAREKHG